jgi:hypothetical protein
VDAVCGSCAALHVVVWEKFGGERETHVVSRIYETYHGESGLMKNLHGGWIDETCNDGQV